LKPKYCLAESPTIANFWHTAWLLRKRHVVSVGTAQLLYTIHSVRTATTPHRDHN